jgi:hypothetical protein
MQQFQPQTMTYKLNDIANSEHDTRVARIEDRYEVCAGRGKRIGRMRNICQNYQPFIVQGAHRNRPFPSHLLENFTIPPSQHWSHAQRGRSFQPSAPSAISHSNLSGGDVASERS